MMNDADLVKEFHKGNTEAFAELVDRYTRPLTMMILKMVRDQEEARDLSQTAFIKAYEGLSRFTMASSFKTWLYSIAINAVKDHVRKKKPVLDNEALERVADFAASSSDQLERAQVVSQLRRAIEELPEKQRLTLQLRIYEEMDYQEIAEMLGGNAGSARGNFFQAVKTLRAKLGERL
jgi:RNA polymerase sigma-70 factor (ECF subfamily)